MQISQRENGMCEIIDIHTHILPETDDGARGIQESIQLIEQAAAQGITGMIATPHFSRHQSVSSLKMKLSTLREEVKKHNPDFQLYLGQENFYHEELTERLDQGEALTMAESRYVLVEFDPAVSYGQLMRGVRRLPKRAWAGGDFLPGLLSADEFCKPAGALVSEGCALVPQTGGGGQNSVFGNGSAPDGFPAACHNRSCKVAYSSYQSGGAGRNGSQKSGLHN